MRRGISLRSIKNGDITHGKQDVSANTFKTF
jgi:hypothetical protein